MSLAPHSRLGQYEIRTRLGAGGMGEVYLAEDSRLKRLVAIKVLAADSTGAENERRRLLREAQAAAALDHPNICSVYEVGEHDGRAFIVMQYVEGETLGARLERQPLAVSEVLDIGIAVAEGLAEAHARGILHRDIKPQNIMLTTRGQPKILDFGLATYTSEGGGHANETHTLLTLPGAIVGTAPYMSSVLCDSFAMSINSGALVCMRKAISKELMRVAISGSPTVSRRIRLSLPTVSIVSF